MNAEPLESGNRYSFLLRAGLVCATICVVLCSGVMFWYLTSHRKHQAAYDAIVKRIQTTGDPLSGAELDAYYAVPAGEDDLTLEYLAAIRMFDPRTLSAAEKTLPVIGSGDDPPAVGAEWVDLPIAEGYLASVAPQLDVLRALAERRGKVRYPIRMADGFAALLPDVQRARDVARRLLLEFHVRMHRGDRAGALASLRALVRLSETLSEEPLLISQLVRIAILGMATKAGETFLSSGPATDADLLALQAAFEDVNLPAALGRALRGERATTYQTLNSGEITTGQLSGSGDGGRFDLSLRNLARLRPGDAALLLQMQTDLIEAADRPLPEAIRGMEQIGADLKRMANEQKDVLPWNRNLLPQLLVPAFDAVGKAFGRGEAHRGALLAAIAVERFRLKHGAAPQKLDELVPEFMAAVPVDPFTGGPLIYVADERGYAIYSLGPDRIDQGGVLSATQGVPPDLGVRIETAIAAPTP